MRQSLTEFEQAFSEEAVEERERRSRLRREAAERSRSRQQQKAVKHGDLRFVALAVAIPATAVIVTLVMFETLRLLLGP